MKKIVSKIVFVFLAVSSLGLIFVDESLARQIELGGEYAAKYSIGKKKFLALNEDVAIDFNNNGEIKITFEQQKKKKASFLLLDFNDSGISEGTSYTVRSLANEAEVKSMIVQGGYAIKKGQKVKQLITNRDSKADGTVTISRLDKDEKIIEGEFDFHSDMAFTKITKRKEIGPINKTARVRGGFVIFAPTLPRGLFLEDSSYFDDSLTFFSNHNEESVAASYQIQSKRYFVSPDGVSLRDEGDFTFIALYSEDENLNSSKITFVVRTEDLLPNAKIRLFEGPLFGGGGIFGDISKFHGICEIEQFMSDAARGIAFMERKTVKSLNREGVLVVNGLVNGQLNASFSFKADLEFLNLHNDGLQKGPYLRSVDVKLGQFTANLPL